MSAHVAVILAAGGSRRLGRPKQLLACDRETLVHRVTRLAVATSPLRTLVVLGASRAEIAPALLGLACEIVINAEWQSGLASSIEVAHAALLGYVGPVLLMSCDQPGLQVAHLEALLRGAANASALCAATRHQGGAGIPAVVPAQMLSAGDDLSGDRGLGARLRQLQADTMFVLEAAELHPDIDTGTDVRIAIEHGWIDASNASVSSESSASG